MSPASPVSYADFSKSILKAYRPPCRRRKTLAKMSQALREFAEFCPTAGDITPDAISDWVEAYAARSPISSFSVLRAFAAACKSGIAMKLLDSDPFAFRAPARWWPSGDLDAPERIRHLSVDQARSLLRRSALESESGDWPSLRLDALVRVYLFTGLRRSEALGLRVEDADLAAGVVIVRPNSARPLKTRASRRRVPIPGPLTPVLASWTAACGSEWLFPGSRRLRPWLGGPAGGKALDRVRQLGGRAGIPGVTILSLRHTYATLGERLGFGELMLQRLLGHRQKATQLHYRHEDADALRDAGDRAGGLY